MTFSWPGSCLITAPSLTPDSINGAASLPCSGGQWSDAAGKRALRLSAGGSHGSSGRG
ncbi:hypothetical protein LTSESEN_4115, partial [Salmonella enterica subsp. enterica serovar Senftenberg str. A4-543]